MSSPSLRRLFGAFSGSPCAPAAHAVPPRGARRGLLFALVAIAGSLVPAAGALACESLGSPSAETAQRHARAVRCEVNQQRAGRGLRALRNDGDLALAARRHSALMVRQGFFDHVSPGGSTLGERVRRAGFRGGRSFGETIGWGSGSEAAPGAIVAAWMASSPHRAVILDASFDEVGLGVAPGSPVGAGGAATVTADFAAR